MLCFGRSLAIKWICMNNQQCITRPTIIDLNLDELHYYPFIINMNRCDRSCNTVEDPLGRICIPHKMEDIKPESIQRNESTKVLKDTPYV